MYQFCECERSAVNFSWELGHRILGEPLLTTATNSRRLSTRMVVQNIELTPDLGQLAPFCVQLFLERYHVNN